MTDIDHKKMILSHEISTIKRLIGNEMVANIEEPGDDYKEYTKTLNEVMGHLQKGIELLRYKGED